MTVVTEQDPAPANSKGKGGAPTREYVVLEQVIFEETESETLYAWLEVHRVEARNGTNALRKAFKELRARRAENGETLDEGVLNCIPSGQWKPTPVRAKKTESITVDLG